MDSAPPHERLRSELAAIAARYDLHDLNEAILTPASADPPLLAVVGEFSTGKSTLVNHLLQRPVMPVAAEPTTQFPVELRQGAEVTYALVDANGSREVVEEARFREASSPQAKDSPYRLGEVTVPSALLESGLVLVDTPGVASASELHQDVTFGYLPRADAILVVLNAQGVSESILTFLRERVLRANASRLVFVVNGLSNTPPAGREDVVTQMTESLAAVVQAPTILPLLLGTDEAMRFGELSPEERSRNGLATIESTLFELLVVRREEVFAAREAKRLGGLGQQLARHLEAYIRALQARSTDEIDREITEHREALQALRDRLHDEVGTLERETRALIRTFDSALEKRLDTVVQKASERLSVLMKKAPSQGKTFAEVFENTERGSFTADVQEWTLDEVQRFGTHDLAPALSGLKEEWRDRLEKALESVVGEDGKPLVDVNPGGGYRPFIEGAIDIGLVVLIDVILPGGFLVAALGKIVGGRALDPIVKALAATIEKMFLEGVVANRIQRLVLNEVEQKLLALRANVRVQIEATLEGALRELEDGIKASFNAEEQARKALLTDARQRRDDGIAEQAARLDQTRKDADHLRLMVS